MSRLFFATIALFAAMVVVHAQQPPAQGRGRGGGQPVQPIQMLKPGLYLVPGGGSNSLVRVTNEGVILVDTKLPGEANYNGLMEQIRSVTTQPVKVVIVTHHHADHTGNNDRFISCRRADNRPRAAREESRYVSVRPASGEALGDVQHG